jgi:hypothetical protein
MRRAGRAMQRRHEPALRLEPVIGLLEQRGDRPAREEGGREIADRRLVRDRLRAVLAELGRPALARIRPGAGRAIEAARLVDLSEQREAAPCAGSCQRALDRRQGGSQPARDAAVGRVALARHDTRSG